MVAVRKVLVVDADELFRRVLAEQLEVHDEFLTSEAGVGANAIELATAQNFDLILLGSDLLDMRGVDMREILRDKGITTPTILLINVDNRGSLDSLSAGANDCVVKPFKIGTLLARARAQIREYEQGEHAVYQIGPYSFSPVNKCFLDVETGQQIRLTDKETAIIKFLYLAGNRIVGRDVLLNEVWGYNAGVTTHTLETHIYRLRQKIETDPSGAALLLTEPKGYRLAI
jgi:DNA-binding response OmpR family regulator